MYVESNQKLSMPDQMRLNTCRQQTNKLAYGRRPGRDICARIENMSHPSVAEQDCNVDSNWNFML